MNQAPPRQKERVAKMSVKSFTNAETKIFDVPAALLWDIMVNVDKFSTVFRSISNVEYPKSSNLHPSNPDCVAVESPRRLMAGSTYKCQYEVGKSKYKCLVSVTMFKEDATNGTYEMSTAVSNFAFTLTSSEMVHQIDEDRCQLISTVGVIPRNWFGRAKLFLMGKTMARYSYEAMVREVEDLYAAVTRRTLKQ
mmetsp:Transcript_6887/g.20213  ORF Transcript_6887/g.20213 Transcript_6887/m.20213 type:complete len:194 (-) Transcript_6887:113-694(-)